MKRALRVIIPVLLALAVIGCSLWYLLVYDRAFTKDLILQQARVFEQSGNHKAAAWLYDMAYHQSSGDASVAIELAENYRAAGNYTKAEYTLSKAIAENRSAELYTALCATYVEQDKLLDAVTMLDTISDPAIKAQLDAKRPSAPKISPEPGYYSQYITVEISSTGGVLYVSTDGAYPSTETGRYTSPITLPGGETLIYAIAVGSDQLVSTCSTFGFTIGGVIEPASFKDPAVEAALREALQVGSSKVLYTDELWDITEFTMPADAKSYADLALLPYLRSLSVTATEDLDLSVLSKLTALETLELSGCRLNEEELTAIGKLTNLRKLTLTGCGVSSITTLSGLTNLEELDLSNNTVRNISALSSMTALKQLNLSSNALTDLSSLSALSALTQLDVSYNSLSNLDSISTLTALTSLNASHNQLTSISLGNLALLTQLDVSYNSIVDVSSLAVCTKLSDLNLSNNALTDISTLNTLAALSVLNFSHNQVTALPAFSKECSLITVDGSNNKITSLSPLSDLPRLNNVYMDYNDGLRSLEPLDSCPLLVTVNVYGTKVKDVSFLTKKSIIVNFDPTA